MSNVLEEYTRVSLEKQTRLNLEHAMNPQVGDYWAERLFTPIARVLDVDQTQVCIQRLAGYSGKEITPIKLGR